MLLSIKCLCCMVDFFLEFVKINIISKTTSGFKINYNLKQRYIFHNSKTLLNNHVHFG